MLASPGDRAKKVTEIVGDGDGSITAEVSENGNDEQDVKASAFGAQSSAGMARAMIACAFNRRVVPVIDVEAAAAGRWARARSDIEIFDEAEAEHTKPFESCAEAAQLSATSAERVVASCCPRILTQPATPRQPHQAENEDAKEERSDADEAHLAPLLLSVASSSDRHCPSDRFDRRFYC